MKYELASTTWGDEERASIERVLNSGITTMGREVRNFESDFAQQFGVKHAIMVNSGSSANLLAIAALTFKSKNPIRRGQEIIVPAVSWSTTYYPVNQYGLRLRFVDIDPDSLCIDINAVEEAINENTAAIFVVNLLGQPAQLDRLKDIADKNKIYLIEDNCESMGAALHGKACGTWGILGTFSTFFSHHISTMEGGVIVTDDDELKDILISLRAHGWTRELEDQNLVYPKSGNEWDDKFRFVLPGYNLRPLEMEGAIGISQLRKLDKFIRARQKNHELFISTFSKYKDIKIQSGVGVSSSFGFSIVLERELSGKRSSLINEFKSAEIETRPIVSGNFTSQPVMGLLDFKITSQLPIASHVHDNGLFLGNHHFDLSAEIEYADSIFNKWKKSL